MNGRDAALRVLAEALLEHEDDALVVLRAVRDEAGKVVDFVYELVNAAAERNAQQPLVGRSQLEVYPVERGSLFYEYRHVLETGEVLRTERVVTNGDQATRGRTYQVYARSVGREHVVCQYRDVSELRAVHQALTVEALHDPLTGLANRRLLTDHIDQALARLSRHRAVLAVLYCDLDDFKRVNDTYGHAAGDELLKEVAAHLLGTVRPEDTVARLGGDEFVVLAEGLADDDGALRLARRVRGAVSRTYRLAAGEATVDVSIGVATTSEPVPRDQLVARADAALYQAKRSGAEPPVALG